MMTLSNSWQLWAFLAAVFAALTAVFAKIGIENVNSNFATFLRTFVIIFALGGFLFFTDQFQPLDSLSQKSVIFIVLSGLATGASWVCYFRALKLGNASQVAPIDKLSVVFVALLGTVLLGEHLSLSGWAGIALISVGALLVAQG